MKYIKPSVTALAAAKGIIPLAAVSAAGAAAAGAALGFAAGLFGRDDFVSTARRSSLLQSSVLPLKA